MLQSHQVMNYCFEVEGMEKHRRPITELPLALQFCGGRNGKPSQTPHRASFITAVLRYEE
jgi:hypothetical protein